MNIKSILTWLLARLKEKTTWAAIITTGATVFGINVAPEQAEAITQIGLALVAGIAVFSTEKPKV